MARQQQSKVATKSAVIVLALAGTAAAFIIGAHAGATLNGRVMSGGSPPAVYMHAR